MKRENNTLWRESEREKEGDTITVVAGLDWNWANDIVESQKHGTRKKNKSLLANVARLTIHGTARWTRDGTIVLPLLQGMSIIRGVQVPTQLDPTWFLRLVDWVAFFLFIYFFYIGLSWVRIIRFTNMLSWTQITFI